jgi:hypothetical protein
MAPYVVMVRKTVGALTLFACDMTAMVAAFEMIPSVGAKRPEQAKE